MLARYGGSKGHLASYVAVAFLLLLFSGQVQASTGDRLPEFRKCVEICERENCGSDGEHTTPIPILHRLLLWSCPAECDYTCQHIVTAQRLAASPPQPILQFHGKWPFRRFLGVQEPLSVICSAGNLWAHYRGLHGRVLATIPPSYPLRPFYVALARIGITSWVFSIVFHTRDFALTEQMDYFGAGASVLFGAYYAVVRIFGLYRGGRRGGTSALRIWSILCLALYAAHVAYLTLVRWDYTYNMTANVVVGAVHNTLWSWYSWRRWRTTRKHWSTWPGLVVAWLIVIMSLELFDFPPVWGVFDAHGLWHLGTIVPTAVWYNFLAKDAEEDIANSERLKA